MGGKNSKDSLVEQRNESAMKRQSSYKASEDEEKDWLEAMSKQNYQALTYGRKAMKKEQKKMSNIIFVVGGPGSGKGTQCERLSADFNLCHLSVGDLLRNEASSGTERGTLLDEYMKEGKIVPMEITLEVLRSAIDSNKGKSGFLIDGFPRKLDQAKEFEDKVAKCTFVLYFECSEDEMTKRLIERGETSGRADDNEDTIKKRLVTFRETSMPVIDYYQRLGRVKAINSERHVDEVYEDTRQIFAANGLTQADLYTETEGNTFLEELSGSQSGKKEVSLPDSIKYPTGSKRAIVAGLNYNKCNFKRNLGGCVKDAILMESILSSKFGFQTLLLTDGDSTAAEPTCANLKEILKRSIEGCTEGDQIVLYFSGHTERVKKDGLHEVVCFSDGGVFDEELFEIFASLHENVVITIIVDGCYSGQEELDIDNLFWKKSKRCIFIASTATTEKSKEMPYTAGGVLTFTLINILKEKEYRIDYESLKSSLVGSLSTLKQGFLMSDMKNMAAKYFLDQTTQIA